MNKKHILEDDSNLLKSVSAVLATDSKRQRAQTEAAYQKSKGQRQMTFTESCRYVAETEAKDSLARYPGDNANSFPTYSKPDIKNADGYYGDKESVAPRQEPNLGNSGDSASIQRELVDAAQKIVAVWSKMLDPRTRMSVNDISAAKRFLKIAFGSLLSEE